MAALSLLFASTVQNSGSHDLFAPLRLLSGEEKRGLHENTRLSHSSHDTDLIGVNTFPQSRKIVHRTAQCPIDKMAAVMSQDSSLVPGKQRIAHSVCAHDSSENVTAG